MATYATFIGTNYRNTVNELYGCENDARDLLKLCDDKVADRHLLLGKKASRDMVYKVVGDMLSDLRAGDVGIVTFSGHGTRMKAGGSYVEAMVWDDLELTFDYEMDALLRQRDRESMLLLLTDCCHSGTMHRGLTVSRQHNPGAIPRTIPISKCAQRKPKPQPVSLRNVLHWAACSEDEYAYDARFGRRSNGAFTYFVIQAAKCLQVASDKPEHTYHDWFQLIAGKRPSGYLPSDDYPQTPHENGGRKLKSRIVPF